MYASINKNTPTMRGGGGYLLLYLSSNFASKEISLVINFKNLTIDSSLMLHVIHGTIYQTITRVFLFCRFFLRIFKTRLFMNSIL